MSVVIFQTVVNLTHQCDFEKVNWLKHAFQVKMVLSFLEKMSFLYDLQILLMYHSVTEMKVCRVRLDIRLVKHF